jgi:hypothetical protein
MPLEVTDVRSNPNDQIAHAARVVGRSTPKRRIFEAICRGKKSTKTVTELEQMTRLPRKRILEEAIKLKHDNIVQQVKVGKDLAYQKDPFYCQHKKQILRLAGNKRELDNFPTKTNPKVRAISVSIPRDMIDARQLTIDDIDSFSKVRSVAEPPSDVTIPIEEDWFKRGLKLVLGEQGDFQDWGGETDDLFSTRLVVRGERKSVAFGLKGKGTTGILTPKKMGKRGDQIQRLFRTSAEAFIVQYWGQVDESIIEQLKNFATAKSAVEGRRIYYGVIDGKDTRRMLCAYDEFHE